MAPPLRSNRGYPPSLRGRILIDATRGVLRARAWPRSRSQATKKKTAEQNEWFRQAQWLSKFVWPEQMKIAREATEGSPLMPRDVLTSAMSGRAFAVIEPDGQVRVGLPVRNDVSASLDLLGLARGSILIRGDDTWYAMPPQDPGHVLTSRGPGNEPHWAPPVGAAGQAIETYTLTIPNFAFQSADLSDWEVVSGDWDVEGIDTPDWDWSASTANFSMNRLQSAGYIPLPSDWHDRIDSGNAGAALTFIAENISPFRNAAAGLFFFNAQLQQITEEMSPLPEKLSIASHEVRFPDIPAGTRYIKIRIQSEDFFRRWTNFSTFLYDSQTAATLGTPLPFAATDLLPDPSPAGRMIFVTDLTPGPIPAYADGSAWRRVTDGSIIEPS